MLPPYKQLLDKVIEGILSHKIIPFIGAGMSKPLGLKDWDELIEDLKRELNCTESDHLRVAQIYEDSFGRQTLLDRLKAYYSINTIETLPTGNHQLILSMTPPVIYTTNYDEVLEKTASFIKRPYYKVASLKDIVNMPHGVNIIVKFHGDFSDEGEIVLTENDYKRRMQIENPLDLLFRRHLLGKGIFFIGYGLRDRNVDFIFQRHASLYGVDNLPMSYLISFGKSIPIDRQEELKKKNIEIILLESAEQLHGILKEINREVYRGNYKKQLGYMFHSAPQEILLAVELENMIDYWNNSTISYSDKANKIEETLSSKIIPSNLQTVVSEFLLTVIEDQTVPADSMETILRTINWSDIDPSKFFFGGIAIVALTERPEFHRRQSNFVVFDPLQTVEHIFKDKGTVFCIFGYLIRCYEKKMKLNQDQLNEIMYTLRACRSDTDDFGPTLSKETMDFILDYFLSAHPGWKPISSFIKPSSLTQLTEGIMKQFPANFPLGDKN